MIRNKNIINSHLRKKSQSKLALFVSLLGLLITSTGYLFNSEIIILLFYIFNFIFYYNLIIYLFLKKNNILKRPNSSRE